MNAERDRATNGRTGDRRPRAAERADRIRAPSDRPRRRRRSPPRDRGRMLVAVRVRALALRSSAPLARLHVPRRPRPRLDVAIGIFAHNPEASGVFGLLLVAQLAARSTGPAPRAAGAHDLAGEVILVGAIAANVLVVGAAIGAYGPRMVVAMLPHGPIELAAYSLALGAVPPGPPPSAAPRPRGQGRRASVALLALAAALETWVTV